MINPNLISKYPNMSATARRWISNISECTWIKDYFSFLNKQLAYLKGKQRKDIITRIGSPDDKQYYEAIAELVYIAFWKYMKWSFEKDPNINEKKPDFKVTFGREGQDTFLCEVAVVRHNHPRYDVVMDGKTGAMTMKGKPINKLPVVPVPLEQAHRFLMKLEEKLDNYRQILTTQQMPFVVCFFRYGENILYLDDHQIRNALFGDPIFNFSTGELWHQPNIQSTRYGQKVHRGIFGFEEYKHLTAVIDCAQECYQTTNIMLKEPKPHYPQKAKFRFAIYVNPLGRWSHRDNNPFSLAGIPVNGLRGADSGFKEIEFY